jgi:disulfide bond formation protein DsbB
VFVEVAKPVALVLCILSLYGVFHTAFLNPASDLEQRIWNSLGLLTLAAGISLTSGLIFREDVREPAAGNSRLAATLPIKMFCWASGLMVILFVVSWYLENYCVFYRDIRVWV